MSTPNPSAPSSPQASAPTRWRRRAALVLGIALGVVLAGSALGYDPEPVRVVLLSALGVLGVGVVADALPEWRIDWDDPRPVRPSSRGRDRTTASHLRALEDNASARVPGPAVRDRLAALADQALRAHHGLTRDSAEGRALLGPEVTDVLDAPPQRLGTRRIAAALDRIEQL